MNSLQNSFNRLTQKRQDQQLTDQKQEMFNRLSTEDIFDLNTFHDMLAQGVKKGTSGIMYFLPKAEAEITELQTDMQIIEAMTYTQRLSHKRLRDEIDRKLLAQKSGQTFERVSDLLRQYEMIHLIWKHMKSYRNQNNGELPGKSLDEVVEYILKQKKGVTKPPPIWQLNMVNEKTNRNLFYQARANQPKKYLEAYNKIIHKK